MTLKALTPTADDLTCAQSVLGSEGEEDRTSPRQVGGCGGGIAIEKPRRCSSRASSKSRRGKGREPRKGKRKVESSERRSNGEAVRVAPVDSEEVCIEGVSTHASDILSEHSASSGFLGSFFPCGVDAPKVAVALSTSDAKPQAEVVPFETVLGRAHQAYLARGRSKTGSTFACDEDRVAQSRVAGKADANPSTPCWDANVSLLEEPSAEQYVGQAYSLADQLERELSSLQPYVKALRHLEDELRSMRSSGKEAGMKCQEPTRQSPQQPQWAAAHPQGIAQGTLLDDQGSEDSFGLAEHTSRSSGKRSEGSGKSSRIRVGGALRTSLHSEEKRSSIASSDGHGARVGSLASCKRRQLLPDVAALQASAWRNSTQSEIEEPLYKKTGCCQKIVQSPLFEWLTFFVIFCNAVWTAFEIDYNEETVLFLADTLCQVMENFFCIYFLVELCLRLFAFEDKRLCYKDKWFPFDAFLVVVQIYETWIFMLCYLVDPRVRASTSFRVMRLFRVLRMVRLSKVLMAMPEITILFKGMVAAFRALVSTLGLIGVLVFFFAVLFRQLTRNTPLEEALFPWLGRTCGVLLLTSTAPDLVSLFEQLSAEHLFYAMLYYCFILLVSYIMLNLLVGVLVNVVAIIHSAEKDQQALNTFGEDMRNLVQNIDDDSDMMISKFEFANMLAKPAVVTTLRKIDVDCIDLLDFTDQIFADDDKEVTFDEMMRFIMSFRKSNNATVKDVVDVRRLVLMEIRKLELLLNRLLEEKWGRIILIASREAIAAVATLFAASLGSQCRSVACHPCGRPC